MSKRHLPDVREAPQPEAVTADMLLERTGLWPERMLVEVGIALNKGRTSAPIEDGETYDDCVGVNYAPLDIETCGFHITALPRRIGVREVARYAKSSCRRCHGVGYQVVQRRVQSGTDELGRKVMQDIGFEQSCGCADRRFQQQHGQVLIDSQLGEWIALDGLQIVATGTLTEQDLQHVCDEVSKSSFQVNAC